MMSAMIPTEEVVGFAEEYATTTSSAIKDSSSSLRIPLHAVAAAHHAVTSALQTNTALHLSCCSKDTRADHAEEDDSHAADVDTRDAPPARSPLHLQLMMPPMTHAPPSATATTALPTASTPRHDRPADVSLCGEEDEDSVIAAIMNTERFRSSFLQHNSINLTSSKRISTEESKDNNNHVTTFLPSSTSTFTSAASTPATTATSRSTSSTTSTASTLKVSAPRPRLTLSAFRRPEQAVRLTYADPSRRLLEEYDLYAPGCRVLGHGAFSTVRLAVRRSDETHVAIKTIQKHEALRSRRLRINNNNNNNYQPSTANSNNTAGCARRCAMEEWEILRRMQSHPYIISLLDLFETDDEIQLVLEYCPGGELFDAIQKRRNRATTTTTTTASTVSSSTTTTLAQQQQQLRLRGQFAEPHAARIIRQILCALQDLHALGIVHRDVKAENILLMDRTVPDDQIHVKLCDLGMARCLLPTNTTTTTSTTATAANNTTQQQQDKQGNINANAVTDSSNSNGNHHVSDGEDSPVTPPRHRSYSVVGSNYYMAPEVIYGESYTTAIDVYSLGVTLYILLCGFPPVFSSSSAKNSEPDADNSSDDTEVVFPASYWNCISDSAKDLVRHMLTSDPTCRITASQALQHTWIEIHNQVPRTTPQVNESTTTTPKAARTTIARPYLMKRRRCSIETNLDLVRSQLSKSLPPKPTRPLPLFYNNQASSPLPPQTKRDRADTMVSTVSACTTTAAAASHPGAMVDFPLTSPRRKRMRRTSSCLMAVADLIRDVAASPSLKLPPHHHHYHPAYITTTATTAPPLPVMPTNTTGSASFGSQQQQPTGGEAYLTLAARTEELVGSTSSPLAPPLLALFHQPLRII